ncbi:MAG TPA: GDSL-type esterase/lipase family protein [Polyangiaceae bacterium]|nr:GDSL-type esterase/lipase family protein [Polyangiaceae bacterium]
MAIHRRTPVALLSTLVALVWSVPCSALTKLACVGDSLTSGYGLQADEAYPAVLQELLGTDAYQVGNFGVSGTTVTKSGNMPYWDTAEYQSGAEFAPNIVVLMLGTNDAKPDNWVNEADFDGDYTALVQYYRATGATVYLGLAPQVYEPGAYDISPEIYNTEVTAHIRQLATDLDAPLIDLFTALAGQQALFPDNVHPNAEGAQLMAQAVHDAVLQAQPSGSVEPGAGGRANAPSPNATASGGNGGTPNPNPNPGVDPSTDPSADPSADPSTEPSADPSTATGGAGGGAAAPMASASGLATSAAPAPSPGAGGNGAASVNPSMQGPGESQVLGPALAAPATNPAGTLVMQASPSSTAPASAGPPSAANPTANGQTEGDSNCGLSASPERSDTTLAALGALGLALTTRRRRSSLEVARQRLER